MLTGYGKGGATSKGDKSKSAEQDGSSGHGPGFGIKEHPRLPNFSGDKKSDDDFDLWRYQVQCLIQEQYSEAVILLAIRRSLKGEAARVVMRLGSQANISDILNKFESIYGLVDKKQILMSKSTVLNRMSTKMSHHGDADSRICYPKYEQFQQFLMEKPNTC